MRPNSDVKAKKTKDVALSTLRRLYDHFALTDKVEYASTRTAVRQVLKKVLKDRGIMASLTNFRTYDSYTFDHAVNVCMLSLLIGLNMGISGKDLHNLGIGALLHDIGMEKVDKSLLFKSGALKMSELKKVQMHPFYGYELILNMPELTEDSAIVAWQHHERLDGSGYPKGLKGDEIHLFAQIAAVADTFDALLADRPFRNAFYPHQAVDILVNSVGQFSPEVVKTLLDKVAIYPLGSRVLLNNGDAGIVVDMNKYNHTRPIVQIETVADKKITVFREVDLSKHQDLYIVRVIRKK